MRQYPIWNRINSCAYKNGNKSFGVKEHSETEVVVGTSSSNSHPFLTHKVTHRQHEDGSRTYRFFVDGILIKEATLTKDGKYSVELGSPLALFLKAVEVVEDGKLKV